ncbi:MAG: hypothetical protein JXA36_00165 [Coriobacteriia bacterium]|nr:hypothetical protein [Coriobacteriia bacterium]
MHRIGALLLVPVLASMLLLGCSGGTSGGSRTWLYQDLYIELLNEAPGYENEVTKDVAISMAKGFLVEEDAQANIPRHDWDQYAVTATEQTESAPGYTGGATEGQMEYWLVVVDPMLPDDWRPQGVVRVYTTEPRIEFGIASDMTAEEAATLGIKPEAP